MSKFKLHNPQAGFTLMEILIVMVIIGILAVLGFGNFQTSQVKGRDAQRRSDLKQIANSLEVYYNDVGQYPVGSGGEIQGCNDGASVCNWGDSFEDNNNTVYMVQLPVDPRPTTYTYYYASDGTYYQLYTRLENLLDSDVPKDGDDSPQSYTGLSCGDGNCNYGISSPNTTPGAGRTLVTE